eukprot:COSAG01_NODE_2014_length_8644_cov_70.285079_5_plen_278_part_00
MASPNRRGGGSHRLVFHLLLLLLAAGVEGRRRGKKQAQRNTRRQQPRSSSGEQQQQQQQLEEGHSAAAAARRERPRKPARNGPRSTPDRERDFEAALDMKAMEAAGKPPRPPQDPVHHFQRVDRRQRAVAALRRVDALLGGAMQTLRVIGGASRHDKPFGKKYALNLRQIFVLNDSLQSMKHSLLEAVELDGGGLAAPERAWMPLLHGLTEFIIELRHLHGIDFDPREYDGFPFRELDLLHLTSTICRIHVRACNRLLPPTCTASPQQPPRLFPAAC